MVESFGSSGTDFMLYINDRAMGIREKMIFGMPQILVCTCVWEGGVRGVGGDGRGGRGWEGWSRRMVEQ